MNGLEIVAHLENKIGHLELDINSTLFDMEGYLGEVIRGENSGDSLTKIQTCLNVVRGKKHEIKGLKEALSFVNYKVRTEVVNGN